LARLAAQTKKLTTFWNHQFEKKDSTIFFFKLAS